MIRIYCCSFWYQTSIVLVVARAGWVLEAAVDGEGAAWLPNHPNSNLQAATRLQIWTHTRTPNPTLNNRNPTLNRTQFEPAPFSYNYWIRTLQVRFRTRNRAGKCLSAAETTLACTVLTDCAAVIIIAIASAGATEIIEIRALAPIIAEVERCPGCPVTRTVTFELVTAIWLHSH